MSQNPYPQFRYQGSAVELADTIDTMSPLGDELPVTHAIVAALLRREFGGQKFADVEFALIDPDIDYEDAPLKDPKLVSYDTSLRQNVLWTWRDHDEGYGEVERVKFPNGEGLFVSYAGNPLASAPCVYIVPVPRED